MSRLAPAAVAVSCALAGCGSAPRSNGTMAGGETTRARSAPGPAAIALSYEQALFSGRFEEAIELVVPSQRNALRVSLLDLSAASVYTTGLFAATTTARRRVAAVTLEGIVCTTSSRISFIGPPSRPRRGRCVANHSIRASNPLFVVKLIKTRRGRWFVRPKD